MSRTRHRRASRARDWVLRAILWLGLAIAVWVIAREAPRLGPSPGDLLAAALWALPLLLAVWGVTILAWQRMVFAFTGSRIGWQRAAHNLGLLLVGKYIPGGVVGFVARAYDVDEVAGEHSVPRAAHVAAGLAEQLGGLLLTTMLGAVLYAAALTGWWWLLVLLAGLPYVVAALLGWMGRRVHRVPDWKWLRALEALRDRVPERRALLAANAFTSCAALLWAGAVATLAITLLGVSPAQAAGASAAFALAVVVGMVVVVAPGGIGAREAAFVVLAAPWLDAGQAIVIAGWMRLMTSALDLIAAMVGLVPSRIRHLLD